MFADLGVEDVTIAGIAKGPDRNAGRETFFMPERQPFTLEPHSPVLYYLQRLRDEAHRFAIGTHRARRSTDIRKSPLDEIPGVGAAAQTGASESFRLGPRGHRSGPRRPRSRRGRQQDTGQDDLWLFP